MEVLTKTVKKKTPTTIVPLGDIQWDGSPDSIAFSILKDDINRGLDAGALFIGMGDYIDFMSPSNRSVLKGARLYDSAISTIQDSAVRLLDEIYEILKPTRGMWLGMLEGHHFFQMDDGLTSDQHLCQMLGCPHLGSSAVVRLEAGKETLTIWASHGTGSGILAGAQINRIDRVHTWMDADVYLMGHWTRLGAVPVPRLHLDSDGSLSDREALLVSTGGYSRAYIERCKQGMTPRGGYVERGLMRPVVLGSCQIIWQPGTKRPRVLI